ncbi:MAG: VWA domain-containing protein [Candidatus Dadabacteria bacterium]|nr:MAG: VWA domain-containing protein [Candidatus Dadabacteria bacterium]
MLTTEQAVVEFNKKTPSKLFTIYYPKEGSYWQDYNLCISQADWVNAAKRAGIRKFIEFLRESDAQELIIQAGFRPSGIHIVGIKRSAFPEALLTQPKKHFLPAAASITKHLIELWNKVKKPLALFIAIDVSGSMAERPLLNSQSIARTLFASLSNRDLAAYYFFSTRKSKPSKFINKKEELIFAVDSATALGGSAVYDGLKVSLRKITEDYEGVLKDKRIVLLVFTDDDDKVSLTTPRALQLIVLDRTSKIPLNFIVIGIQNSSGQNWQPLQQIVKEGGGILKIVAKDDWGNVLKFIKDRL